MVKWLWFVQEGHTHLFLEVAYLIVLILKSQVKLLLVILYLFQGRVESGLSLVAMALLFSQLHNSMDTITTGHSTL